VLEFTSPQVMKDFRASIALALEDGGEDLAEESALWQESASNFWKAQAMSTAELKAVQKKKNQVAKFRISARDWLAAADSMLKASAGVGLVDFIVTPAMEASVPPASWPGITVCID
jgi:hypothetical protein